MILKLTPVSEKGDDVGAQYLLIAYHKLEAITQQEACTHIVTDSGRCYQVKEKAEHIVAQMITSEGDMAVIRANAIEEHLQDLDDQALAELMDQQCDDDDDNPFTNPRFNWNPSDN